MRHLLLPFSALVVMLVFAACGDDDNNSSSTTGSGSASSGSGASGGDMSAAGGGGAGGGTGGGCLMFGSSCEVGVDACCNAAEQPGVCFPFGQGARCTILCPTDPAACPNNGAGCNMQNPPHCKTS